MIWFLDVNLHNIHLRNVVFENCCLWVTAAGYVRFLNGQLEEAWWEGEEKLRRCGWRECWNGGGCSEDGKLLLCVVGWKTSNAKDEFLSLRCVLEELRNKRMLKVQSSTCVKDVKMITVINRTIRCTVWAFIYRCQWSGMKAKV